MVRFEYQRKASRAMNTRCGLRYLINQNEQHTTLVSRNVLQLQLFFIITVTYKRRNRERSFGELSPSIEYVCLGTGTRINPGKMCIREE